MQFSKPVSSGAYKLIVAVLGHERAGEPLKRVFPFWEVVLYGLQMLTNADIKLLVSPPSLSSRWDIFKGQAVSRASGTGARKLTPVPTTLAISLLGALPPNPCLHHSDLFSKDIIVWFNTIVYNRSKFAHRVWIQFF